MNLRNIPLWQIATALLVVAFLVTGGWYYYRISNRIVWSMIHVSGDIYSGDAHVLEFPTGHIVLIDTGFERFTNRNLIPYLDQRGIDHIDELIVTHAHRNHYGGIKSLLRHLKYIDTIYFNVPPRKPCDKENWSTGCNYGHVLQTHKLIEESGTELRDLKTDQLLYNNDEQDTFLEVVFVHDGESEPVGKTDINDTSALLRLVYGSTTVLFTGDVNRKVGRHLVEDHYFLESTIVTAPHHGVEGAASNEFLDKVNAKVLMVSNSARHWQGTRGDRIRQFAQDHGMQTYVTGLHGNVIVTLTRDGFEVNTAGLPQRN